MCLFDLGTAQVNGGSLYSHILDVNTYQLIYKHAGQSLVVVGFTKPPAIDVVSWGVEDHFDFKELDHALLKLIYYLPNL